MKLTKEERKRIVDILIAKGSRAAFIVQNLKVTEDEDLPGNVEQIINAALQEEKTLQVRTKVKGLKKGKVI